MASKEKRESSNSFVILVKTNAIEGVLPSAKENPSIETLANSYNLNGHFIVT